MDHPGSIKDGFFIQGFDFGAYEDLDDNQAHFEKVLELLSGFAHENGATCIPVQTNLRHLDDDDDFFHNDCFGAALASIPHLFTRRLAAARIPPSGAISTLYPQGSHPLLDMNYSSASLEIIHDGAHLTRQERVLMVAEWDSALRHLRSCYDAFRTEINCGKCEKCLRTMTALLVAGKLKDCLTYPVDDLAPEHLEVLDASPLGSIPADRKQLLRLIYRRLTAGNAYFWRGMLESLQEIGRQDLANVIERKLKEFRIHQDRLSAKGLPGVVKRFDWKCLNGSLASLCRRIKGN